MQPKMTNEASVIHNMRKMLTREQSVVFYITLYSRIRIRGLVWGLYFSFLPPPAPSLYSFLLDVHPSSHASPLWNALG